MRGFSSAVLVLVAWASVGLAQASPARSWMDKIDPAVWQSSGETASGEVDFIVVLAEQADLRGASLLRTKAEKGAFVFEQLKKTAQRSQPAVLRALEAKGLKSKPFWVANMIQVWGTRSALQEMAERADVAAIYANPLVRIQEKASELAQGPTAPAAISPNVVKIRAPEAWALGYRGQGIVIGAIGTGVQWDHPALKANYRGWLGFVANHAYDWHDATAGAGSCRSAPCDPDGHGTHTIGIAVGDESNNQIGVAPGAKWIACRAVDQGGLATPATYSECLQWFIAPTDLQDQNPDSRLAPDILNNSWECRPSDGCTNPTLLQALIKNVRAAGILVVASAGNSGPNCSTVQNQPAINAASITVGATDINDNIAAFSSRGPVTIDGSSRLKPDLTAPGVNIRSSLPTNAYGNLSGTSMSAPHVAGTAALLLSARPDLSGDVDDIQRVLEETAVPLTSLQTCGGVAGSTIPNNTFGWGRIDALAAVSSTPAPTPTATPTATPGPTPGLVGNVATRLPVGTADNVLIEGFIVLGPGGSTKKIMVRALGPFLTQFGVPDALANPTLEIRDGSNTVVATNNDWRNTQVGGIIAADQVAEIEGSGLAPSNNLESAIIANLAPGNYTAVVSGVNNSVGTGIVDAYDMSAASPARLANIATRGLIQPGDQLMIAGFIIQNGNVRAVVRAIGPSLSAFGISNALPDTTLQLRDVNGAIVRENDDWQSDQKVELEATGLQPGNALEAAIVDTIAPGQYTVQVRGKPETTGIGLVEVYFIE